MKPEEWITQDKAIGMRFGRLIVLEIVPAPEHLKHRKHPHVRCRCSCGELCVKRLANLVSGLCRSCGCMSPAGLRGRQVPRNKPQPEISITHVTAALDAMAKAPR